jgi:hypothetical protein
MTTVTFDESPPRRPALDDFGGADFEDDTSAPPERGVHPSAEDFNQACLVAARLAGIAFVAQVEVSFSAGDPVLANFVSLVAGVTSETFTLTDNAAGNTSIEWPANTFPAGVMPHAGLTIVEDVEIDRARAIPITNGVQVITKLGATGTDAGFTLLIMRQ